MWMCKCNRHKKWARILFWNISIRFIPRKRRYYTDLPLEKPDVIEWLLKLDYLHSPVCGPYGNPQTFQYFSEAS